MTGTPGGNLAAGVLARVGELLAGLSAAEVAALAQGRMRLAVVPVAPAGEPAGPTPVPLTASLSPAAPVPPTPSGVDLTVAAATLDAMAQRRDGTAYLTPWPLRDLRALAARLGLRGVGGLRKAELVERLVDRTVGFRAASAAVRAR
ncbi:Rho termination factor N-terminal domain-containing protein [Micromonospora sp. WMMD714]|uniref:Rho termination factor N-terminal domain-containing protein n=1 Tax=Micromonospora sp. WMMD714 TaxID=3016097 RepID=UPI00249A8B73|nr:Rho termination factor N-terminal domain-containing protein [Micromonospora sp. WMMD714]WFE64189.1 Rho termination factor N-terminal domain-containing protein [Micromonospora sp. WMMD714]